MASYIIYDDNDEAYMKALASDPRQLVLSTPRSESDPKAMIHSAKCHHVADPSVLKQGKSYVEKETIKVLSPNARGLWEYVRQRKTLPVTIKSCRDCKAADEITIKPDQAEHAAGPCGGYDATGTRLAGDPFLASGDQVESGGAC